MFPPDNTGHAVAFRAGAVPGRKRRRKDRPLPGARSPLPAAGAWGPSAPSLQLRRPPGPAQPPPAHPAPGQLLNSESFSAPHLPAGL